MGEGFVFSRFFGSFESSQEAELTLYGAAFEGFASDAEEVIRVVRKMRACLKFDQCAEEASR
jgi:hypothetical protein